MFTRKRPLFFIWFVLLGFTLGACQSVSQTDQPAPTVLFTDQPVPTYQAESPQPPIETPGQTPTATQEAALAILLAPEGSDPEEVEAFRTALKEPITQAGLGWELQTELDLQREALKLVLVLPPDPGIANLAATAPQIQFVAIDMPGLRPAENLSLVGREMRYDQHGFLAGVIAAMITPDWRVGAISVADTIEGRAARNGFMNGAVYFCGLCQAYHGPIFDYPLYVEIPSGAGQAEWQTAVDTLVSQAVKTVYIFPGAGDPPLLELLAQAGINIIMSGKPSQNLSARWVASIDSDPITPLVEALPDLLAGKGSLEIAVPVVFREVNPELFSLGKQKLAEEIRIELLKGRIDTGVDPLTGENR